MIADAQIRIRAAGRPGESREQGPQQVLPGAYVGNGRGGRELERASECKGICPPSASGRIAIGSPSRRPDSALNVPSWPHLGRDDRLSGAAPFAGPQDLISLTRLRQPCPVPKAGFCAERQG